MTFAAVQKSSAPRRRPLPTLRSVATPVGIAAGAGVIALVVLTIIGPKVWGSAAATTVVADRMQGPSPAHPFGTDELGRDVVARVMVATRLSVLLTLGATALSIVGGTLIGLLAAALPRYPRRLLTGLIDILLAFPWLLLVLFFSAIWGASARTAMLAVGLSGIPTVARLVYTLASSAFGRDYVRAARVIGVGPLGVLGRHVLPNIANPLLVNTAATASVTLLSFAGLSFLGLGVQAPAYDWGQLLQQGNLRIYVNPMAAVGPGMAIVVAGVVFSLVSEAITTSRGSGLRAVRRIGAAAVLPRLRRQGEHERTIDDRHDESDDVEAIAQLRSLSVAFPGAERLVTRVRDVDLDVRPGETIGIVGESGSGKSLTAMALAGLLEAPAVVDASVRRFADIDLDHAPTRTQVGRLGTELAMIFQDPLTSLNPALTIGRQLTEVPQVHLRMSRRQARERAAGALAAVGIDDPVRRLGRYPHEFSGGMRQRAMIGMALAGRPKLLIADEPTTALDVTVQRQVMSVLRRAQRETGAAVVFISHDIALVSAFCDRVLVMKDGQVVEELDARRIAEDARHPYTKALISCLPDMTSDRSRPLPVIGTAEVSSSDDEKAVNQRTDPDDWSPSARTVVVTR